MSSPTRTLFLAVLLVIAGARPAQAQQGPDLGDLFLSFHPTLVVQQLDLEANATFDVYVKVQVDFADVGEPTRNTFDGVKTWEACLSFPPEVTITDRIVTHPSFNGADESCDENWQMVLDSCLRTSEASAILVRYRCRLSLDVTNLEIAIGGASPSSIEGERPGWFQCLDTGQTGLHAFASGYTEPLVINSEVTVEESSWSALKDDF